MNGDHATAQYISIQRARNHQYYGQPSTTESDKPSTSTWHKAKRQANWAPAPVLWHKSDKPSTSTLAQKQRTDQLLSTNCILLNTFTGSSLSAFLLSSNQNLEIKHVSCFMWTQSLKDSKSCFHLDLAASRHLSLLTSHISHCLSLHNSLYDLRLYSVYTCEPHSIRNS